MDEPGSADKLLRLNKAHYSVVVFRAIAIVTLVIAVATTVLTIIDLLRDKSIEHDSNNNEIRYHCHLRLRRNRCWLNHRCAWYKLLQEKEKN